MLRRTVAVLFAVAATQAAACSSGKATAPSSAASPTTTASAPTSTVAGAPNPNAPEIVAPGDIPDNQVYVAFTSPAGYAIKVPEGWARAVSGGTVTFTDHYNSIQARITHASVKPTIASNNATVVPHLRSTVNGFKLGKVTTVVRPAGTAVLTTYEGGSAPDPVTGKVALLDVEQYVFWHAGTELVLTLSGAHGSDNVDPWKTVTNSVAWR